MLLTGDYKFDQTPVDGPPADVSRLAELGSEGVLLLCGDSTNADRPGFSPSEREVGPAPRGGVRPGRRADHRDQLRLQHPPRPAGRRRRRRARAQGRAGRPLDAQERQHRPLARPHRGPRGDDDPAPGGRGLARPQGGGDLHRHPRASRCRRCAGWPTTTIARSRCAAGDTVVFSATPIPGNERAVGETVDRLYHIGCNVITPAGGADPRLRPRLRRGAQADAQPGAAPLRDAGPRRPQAHPPARPAGRCGGDRPRATCSRARTGCRSRSTRAARASASPSSAGMIFVDGVDIGDPADVALRDRRMLSADGIFIVVATVSEQTGESVAPPEVIFRGVPFIEQADGLVADIRDEVERSLAPRRRGGHPGDRPAPAGAARRSRRVRLRPVAPPADGAAGGRRGLIGGRLGGRGRRR